MKTTLRRKMLRTPTSLVDIESDGRTVWVNQHGRCVARFCPISREFLIDETKPWMVKHSHGPSIVDWTDFCSVVELAFHLNFPQEHRPLYIQDVAA
jgi:antitoxin (DNA-binding transcriptional repressor) of toxin-antitoxin stability system